MVGKTRGDGRPPSFAVRLYRSLLRPVVTSAGVNWRSLAELFPPADAVPSGAMARRVKSVFTQPLAFAAVWAARSLATNLLALACLLAVGLWYQFTFNNVSTVELLGENRVSYYLYVTSHDYHRYIPLVLAAIAYLVVRYRGAVTEPEGKFVVFRSAFLVLLPALPILWFLPGTWSGRFMPIGVAVVIATVFRWWRPLRLPTIGAGVRPSRRAFLHPGRRSTLRACRSALVGIDKLDTARLDRAVATFRRARDARSEAYAWATAVEGLLARGRFKEARAWATAMRSSQSDSGNNVAIAASSMAAWQLLGLANEPGDGWAGAPDVGGRFRRESKRLRRVWRRHNVAVLLSQLRELACLAETEPDVTLRQAYKLAAFAPLADDDVPHAILCAADVQRMLRIRGLALMLAGAVFERGLSYQDAALAYGEAAAAFLRALDKVEAAWCRVLRDAHAVRAGIEQPAHEAEALDRIKSHLSILEQHSWRFAHRHGQWPWDRTLSDLYDVVVKLVHTGATFQHEKLSELVQWLQHRRASANGGTEPSAPIAWTTGSSSRSEAPDSELSPRVLAGAVLDRVLAHASSLTVGRPAGTLDFMAAVVAMDDTADWTAFTVGAGVGDVPVNAPSYAEAGGAVGLPELGGVLVTERLAAAVRRGQDLAGHLGDDHLLPCHVVYGACTDCDTAVSRWLRDHGTGAVEQRHLLADRVFGFDLPSKRDLEAATGRATSRHATMAADSEDPPFNRRHVAVVAACAVAFAVLCPTGTKLVSNITALSEPGHLGVVVEPTSDGPVVEEVVPGSPAHRAGLTQGDIIVAVAGVPTNSGVWSVRDVVRAHRPGEVVEVAVVREGNHVVSQATLVSPP